MADTRFSFTFDKCLGKGGFGEVYLATWSRPGGLSRRVAVKVLRERVDADADDAVRRMRDEGRMLSLLEHPCILGVLEMTQVDGRLALVTEYIEGNDVSAICKAAPIPARAAVGVIGEVASALASAWNTISAETGKPLQLIHRDIKPQNIRISRHGEVKLLDFGIARSSQMLRDARTAIGKLPFTPGYAAPEAIMYGNQGPESDIYSLGATLFRMLYPEKLFPTPEIAGRTSLLGNEEKYTAWLGERLALLPPRGYSMPLVDLIRAMLAWDPVDRPTAEQVARQCELLDEALPGPTHVRWARGLTYQEPAGLPDAALVGRTVIEDVAGDTFSGEDPPELESGDPYSDLGEPEATEIDPDRTALVEHARGTAPSGVRSVGPGGPVSGQVPRAPRSGQVLRSPSPRSGNVPRTVSGSVPRTGRTSGNTPRATTATPAPVVTHTTSQERDRRKRGDPAMRVAFAGVVLGGIGVACGLLAVGIWVAAS